MDGPFGPLRPRLVAPCGSRTEPTRVRGSAPVRPPARRVTLLTPKDHRMSAPTTTLAPLVVAGLSVTYPDRAVLTGIDLLAQPGRRIGLVGENGVGKSTLLRAVAGRLPERAPALRDRRGAGRPRAAGPGAALPGPGHRRRGPRDDPRAPADGGGRRRAARGRGGHRGGRHGVRARPRARGRPRRVGRRPSGDRRGRPARARPPRSRPAPWARCPAASARGSPSPRS